MAGKLLAAYAGTILGACGWACAGYEVRTAKEDKEGGEKCLTWTVAIGRTDKVASFHIELDLRGITVVDGSGKGPPGYVFTDTAGANGMHSLVWQAQDNNYGGGEPRSFDFLLCFRPARAGDRLTLFDVPAGAVKYDYKEGDRFVVKDFGSPGDPKMHNWAFGPSLVPAPASAAVLGACAVMVRRRR